MTTSVSDIRVVPVGEDLTTEDLTFSVLRGLEKAHRVDKKLATPSTELLKGEWAVLVEGGKVERCASTAVAQSYPVWCGTDRFDVKANGQVTLFMATSLIVKTARFDPDQDYVVGSYLTAKDWGTGESSLTLAGSGEPKHARVQEVGTGYLVVETLSGDAVV